jgi:hypothetical protein
MNRPVIEWHRRAANEMYGEVLTGVGPAKLAQIIANAEPTSRYERLKALVERLLRLSSCTPRRDFD